MSSRMKVEMLIHEQKAVVSSCATRAPCEACHRVERIHSKRLKSRVVRLTLRLGQAGFRYTLSRLKWILRNGFMQL